MQNFDFVLFNTHKGEKKARKKTKHKKKKKIDLCGKQTFSTVFFPKWKGLKMPRMCHKHDMYFL